MPALGRPREIRDIPKPKLHVREIPAVGAKPRLRIRERHAVEVG